MLSPSGKISSQLKNQLGSETVIRSLVSCCHEEPNALQRRIWSILNKRSHASPMESSKLVSRMQVSFRFNGRKQSNHFYIICIWSVTLDFSYNCWKLSWFSYIYIYQEEYKDIQTFIQTIPCGTFSP
jgi:hypothetical protein